MFPSLPSVVGCSGNPHERELLSSMQKKKKVIAEDGELERCMVLGTVGVSNHLCSDYYERKSFYVHQIAATRNVSGDCVWHFWIVSLKDHLPFAASAQL